MYIVELVGEPLLVG